MRYPAWINIIHGVPTVSNFTTTLGAGAPIIVDQDTDTAYYLADGDVVTALSGGGGAADHYIPLVDGSEPPNFITDGSGGLIMVPWSP